MAMLHHLTHQLVRQGFQKRVVTSLPLRCTFSSRLFSTGKDDADKDAAVAKEKQRAIDERYNEKYSHLQEVPGSREHTRSEFISATIGNWGISALTVPMYTGLGKLFIHSSTSSTVVPILGLLPGDPYLNLFIIGTNAATSYFFYFRGMRHAKIQHWLAAHAASYPVFGASLWGGFKIFELLN